MFLNPLILISPSLVIAAAKTSIYIDEIPLYSELPQCAMDRMSAIVRAQSSGCGDRMQLTSFTCFCMDQSSHMLDVISTAVDQSCRADATASVTASGPLPEVTSAIQLFSSYCARSTELSLYQEASGKATITQAPTLTGSPTPTYAPKSSRNSAPIAAIVAPVVVGGVVISGVIALLFLLRPWRDANTAKKVQEMPNNAAPVSLYGGEVAGNEPDAREMKGSTVRYAHELETNVHTVPVELDGNDREDGTLKSSQSKT